MTMSAPRAKRGSVTGLLIGAVTPVSIVGNREDAELLGKVQCIVGTRIINQNDVVDDLGRDLGKRPCESVRRIVRGHHHADPIGSDHRRFWLTARS